MAQESAATLEAPTRSAYVHLRPRPPLVFEAYRDDRDMGSFILDRPASAIALLPRE